MGTRVHGMLSMSVFYDYIVKIDYQRRHIRVKQVKIGDYSLNDVLVSFPDSMSITQKEQVPGRNGSIGSENLSINNVSVYDFSMDDIYKRFVGPEGEI
ncbi:MAG TPA: hypothetical protein ENI20_05795 [Bacteroides sp.]|nr:hypothetical protein [Bacteroides sp.]